MEDLKKKALELIQNQANLTRAYTLVELLSFSNQLIERIVLNEGEITPEIEEEFLSLTLEAEHKIDSYAFVLQRMKAEAEFWKKKIEAMDKIKKGLENAEERLKKRIKEIMIQNDLKVLEGHDESFHLKKSKDRLLVEELKLPLGYWKTRVEQYYDKEELRKAHELSPIPGVHTEASFALSVKPSRKVLK